MSVFKRAMDYLGLGPDDAYDDYDFQEEADDRQPARPTRPAAYDEPRPAARPAPRSQSYEDREPPRGPAPVRPQQRSLPSRDLEQPAPRPRALSLDDSSVQPRPVRQGSTVRVPEPRAPEPHTVRAIRFEHAQEVADKFKSGQPVIMNIEGTDRGESRRLIDFASGLCYGLGGSMEKVASGVYLLKPKVQPRHDDGYGDLGF